jgi:hypothetical protein
VRGLLRRKKVMFVVEAIYDLRTKGTSFGPFEKRQGAEACLLIVASRPDVVSAVIIETNEKEKRHGDV